MARDAVVNVVTRLMNSGYDPRRVGEDAWESRCPVHRTLEPALAITRNELGHVVLECRSDHKCAHIRIVGALGMTNDQLYTETPDVWIARLKIVPVQAASFPVVGESTSGAEGAGAGPSVGERANGSSKRGREEEQIPRSKVSDSSPDGPVNGAPVPQEAAPRDATGTLEREAGGALPVLETEGAAAPLVLKPEVGNFENPLDRDPMLGKLLSVISVSVDRGDRLERQSSVQALARLAANARMFRSADGRFCAQVPVGDRLEIYGLRSAAFRDWLIDGFLANQPEPPSNWAIRRVIGMLEARARFTKGLPEVFVRVGQHGDAADSTYFLDLGDPSGKAVAIRNDGWRIVDRPLVHFRRPEGLLPMPVPAREGSIDLLRSYVNLSEADFRLMIAWLTAVLRPVGPYPVLILNGEQAAGKSSLAKILRMLIDPQTCPSLALPDSTQNLMATAVHGWLLVYENITTIPGWLSDCVCQLAFGGGYASRELFTNGERSIIYAQRPVVLVGIADFVVRGDLRDRSVFLHPPAIPQTARRTERSFWPEFQADYPRILGGVLDAIVGGLRELPSVHLKELPRMADYAEWGEAVGRGLGWGNEAFLSTYNDNRKAATEAILEDSTVAPLVLALTRLGVNWSGTPQELYELITKTVGRKLGPRWPTTVAKFGVELRRIAPQLRLHGLAIDFERNRDGRIVTLRADSSVTAPSSPETGAAQ